MTLFSRARLVTGRNVDRAAFRGRAGVAVRGHDDRQRKDCLEFGRFRVQFIELAGGAQPHDVRQIVAQPHHQHLALRIAEAGVVFDQLGAVRRQHQPGEEHALIGVPLFAHGAHGGLDDLGHDAGLQFRRQHRRGGIGAHAAGVGAGIPVADALVILRRAEGDDGGAVSEREEARFLAFHELLDHHLRACAAEGPAEHVGERILGLCERCGDHHALARRQTIGLEHVRRGKAGEGGAGFLQRRGAHVAGGRDARAGAEVLGEALGAFELGCGLRGAEHRHACGPQRIRQPVDQRRLGPNHHEIDGLVSAKGDHRAVIGRIERHAFRFFRDAGISGGGVEPSAARGLRQRPCQRMFAASRTQKQDIHGPSAQLR